MESLWHQLPRIRAERALAAAQAAVYPHLRKDHAKRWWDATVKMTQQVARGAVQAAKTLFTLNGRPMNPDQMKRGLTEQLGGGFQGDEGSIEASPRQSSRDGQLAGLR
jgi:hypothetical protein